MVLKCVSVMRQEYDCQGQLVLCKAQTALLWLRTFACLVQKSNA